MGPGSRRRFRRHRLWADGAVWGGEFLLCAGTEYERLAHLDYLPMLGGFLDEGRLENRACYGHFLGCDLPPHLAGDERRPLVEGGAAASGQSDRQWQHGAALRRGGGFLNLQDVNRYEGECAIRLENAAAGALGKGAKNRLQ